MSKKPQTGLTRQGRRAVSHGFLGKRLATSPKPYRTVPSYGSRSSQQWTCPWAPSRFPCRTALLPLDIEASPGRQKQQENRSATPRPHFASGIPDGMRSASSSCQKRTSRLLVWSSVKMRVLRKRWNFLCVSWTLEACVVTELRGRHVFPSRRAVELGPSACWVAATQASPCGGLAERLTSTRTASRVSSGPCASGRSRMWALLRESRRHSGSSRNS